MHEVDSEQTEPDERSALPLRFDHGFVRLDTLRRRNAAPMKWLVEGLIRDGSLTIISGEPKARKTWCGLELAVGVATGTPVFGHFEVPTARNVLAVLAEDDPRSVLARLDALARGRGLDPALLEDHVAVWSRAHVDLRVTTDVGRLINAAKAAGPGAVLILDPLRDLHGGEENSSTDMREVMQTIRIIRDNSKADVVLVHHAGKGGQAGGQRAAQRMRGSSVIHATLDAGLHLTNARVVDHSTVEISLTHELKAGRSAGSFKIRVRADDNDDGVAELAQLQALLDSGHGGGVDGQLDDLAVGIGLALLEGPLGERRLHDKLGADRGTIRRRLDGMAERGLIVRDRQKGTELTASGRAWVEPQRDRREGQSEPSGGVAGGRAPKGGAPYQPQSQSGGPTGSLPVATTPQNEVGGE